MALTTEPAPAPTAAAVRRPAGLPPWLTGGRLLVTVSAAALAVAALSLLIPSTPSYDPWSWLIWGREIVHLDLHTTGGPSWKPLPVMFTSVFALFGGAAPDLWLVVARAGAIVSVVMCARLAWRMTRRLAGVAVIGPAALAAVIAGGSLIVGSGFISDNALGYSEGLMTALVLLALERHLDGAHRQAFAIGLGAALDRPEIWAFWGLYGLWLSWRDPGARRLVLGLFALIPIFWFLPEYWGSGQLFRGVSRAQKVRSNSAANASFPFWAELSKHAWKHVLLRVKVPAAVAMLTAAWHLRRRGASGRLDRRSGETSLLLSAGLGIAWWVLIAVMTQGGFSGNDRYLILGAALISVAGGVAWGWGAHGIALGAHRLLRGRGLPGRQTAGALLAAALFMVLPPWIGANVVDVQATHRALAYQARLRGGLSAAVDRLGGPARILRCGTVMTEGFQVPLLAWKLHVHTVRVTATPLKNQPIGPPPNVIFQTRAQRKATLLPTPSMIAGWSAAGAHYRVVARTRTFRVYSTCAI